MFLVCLFLFVCLFVCCFVLVDFVVVVCVVVVISVGGGGGGVFCLLPSVTSHYKINQKWQVSQSFRVIHNDCWLLRITLSVENLTCLLSVTDTIQHCSFFGHSKQIHSTWLVINTRWVLLLLFNCCCFVVVVVVSLTLIQEKEKCVK